MSEIYSMLVSQVYDIDDDEQDFSVHVEANEITTVVPHVNVYDEREFFKAACEYLDAQGYVTDTAKIGQTYLRNG